MPAAVKTEEDEKKWSEAKKKAAEQGHAEDWAYVMSIYKNMKGEKDSEKEACMEKSAYIDGYLRKTAESSEKGVPKRDGSGKGVRANKGRGGCPPEEREVSGKGRMTKEELIEFLKTLKENNRKVQ